MLRIIYTKLCAISQDKKHQLFVDCTITAFASYLALKKTFGWPLTAILSVFLKAPVIEWFIFALSIVCVYSALAKVFYMVTSAFPASRIKNKEVEDLTHCCFSINGEIQRHIERITTEPLTVSTSFLQNHNFQVNVAIVTDSLARHMLSTLSGAKAKDLFISVYQVPSFSNLSAARSSLEYVCHYPQRKDAIVSKSIVFSDDKFKNYECIKCVSAPDKTWAKIDCSDYYKSKTSRHKKIKHYIGMKLLHKDVLLGFVNIEFYNSSFFSTDEEIRTYLEENILTFRYLIEYQFLKSTFFSALRPHLR
jgi:hypothetical protein